MRDFKPPFGRNSLCRGFTIIANHISVNYISHNNQRRCHDSITVFDFCGNWIGWDLHPTWNTSIAHFCGLMSLRQSAYNHQHNRQFLQSTIASTYSATIHSPLYVYEDCIGFCMSLLTIKHSWMMLDKNPPNLVTALNSFPLVGRRIAYVERTRHFCQTGAVGIEPTHGGIKIRCVAISPHPYAIFLYR